MSNNATKIIDEKARELQQELNKLPVAAKDIGLQFFKSRFVEQGWRDKGFEKWKPRKKTAKRNEGRAILIDTGRLRNSIAARIEEDKIIFGTDVPYAKIHNEGGVIHHPAGERKLTFKKYSRGKFAGKTLFAKNDLKADFGKKVNVSGYDIHMPQREFIGESAYLNDLLVKKIENVIKNVFK